jgi:hypothetical protein
MSGKPLAFLREAAGLIGGGSVYLTASAASAAALGLAAGGLGRPVPLWWFCGLFLPVAPLYLWFSSGWAVRRRLRYFRALQDEKLISPQQAAELRRALLRWYALRQFGRAGLELPPEADPPDEPH